MLTDTSIELRSPSPSLLMRFVKWLVGRRPAVFPHDEAGFHAVMAGRALPEDAPMPESFRSRFIVDEREVLGHKVVTLHPKSGPAEWHMLYFHGGGFVRPMFKEHWPLVAEMVTLCGISVTVPLYPVVPEASYTAQDELADAVYAELAAGHDPARIILNGDSAGGHMALALSLRLVKAGGPQPGKLALFAPWLDLGLADRAIAAVEPHDIMLKIGTLRACGSLVAAGRALHDPAVSPLYAAPADLAQLPPTGSGPGGTTCSSWIRAAFSQASRRRGGCQALRIRGRAACLHGHRPTARRRMRLASCGISSGASSGTSRP